ncbi:hypothetical protein KKF38_02465 [Patescibacteria group bacterium]|nr:hypothetical protein [Patescibacteria group bacterium]
MSTPLLSERPRTFFSSSDGAFFSSSDRRESRSHAHSVFDKLEQRMWGFVPLGFSTSLE